MARVDRDRRSQGNSARQYSDDPGEIAREARNRGAITYKALRYCDRVRLRYPLAVVEQQTTGEWTVWDCGGLPGCMRYLVGASCIDERQAWHNAERNIELREGPDVFDRLWRRAVGFRPKHGEERAWL